MHKAVITDKKLVVDILVQSFADNKIVQYIVKQDSRKEERLRKLMAYSFEICYRFGEVYLTEDKKACALILFPHQKKTSIASIWLDLGLAYSVIGLSNLKKAFKRESKIKQLYPKTPTSTSKNVPWYEQFGFVTHNKLDFGYELFCMRKD